MCGLRHNVGRTEIAKHNRSCRALALGGWIGPSTVHTDNMDIIHGFREVRRCAGPKHKMLIHEYIWNSGRVCGEGV